jgi:hypothetical protein
MPTRLLLALLVYTLVVGVASADPPLGRSPGKGRSSGRGRSSHSNFTSALQQLSKSFGKRPSGGPPQPGMAVTPTTPAAKPETPPAAKPEPAPVVNPAQVPNPLADLKPVIASPTDDEGQEEEETPAPLSGGAIAAIVGGIAFGVLLLVGLTVMIVHHRRGTPKYRRPRRRDEIDQDPTDV